MLALPWPARTSSTLYRTATRDCFNTQTQVCLAECSDLCLISLFTEHIWSIVSPEGVSVPALCRIRIEAMPFAHEGLFTGRLNKLSATIAGQPHVKYLQAAQRPQTHRSQHDRTAMGCQSCFGSHPLTSRRFLLRPLVQKKSRDPSPLLRSTHAR